MLEARNSGAPPLISVAPTATVRQALNLMSTYNVSQLPVLDGGDGVGAVSEPTLMAKALEQPGALDQAVQEVMDAPFPVVDADLPVERLTALLSRETPAALVRRDIGLCLMTVAPESEAKVIGNNQAFLDGGGLVASIFPESKYALPRLMSLSGRSTRVPHASTAA